MLTRVLPLLAFNTLRSSGLLAVAATIGLAFTVFLWNAPIQVSAFLAQYLLANLEFNWYLTRTELFANWGLWVPHYCLPLENKALAGNVFSDVPS